MISVLARKSTLVALLLLAVVGVDARFHVEKANFNVRMPASIKGTYEMAIANFGTPLYGATLACVPAPPRRPGRALSRPDASSSPTARARPGKRHAPRRIHRLTPHVPSPVAAAHLCTLPRITTRATPSPCVPNPRSASRPFTTTPLSFDSLVSRVVAASLVRIFPPEARDPASLPGAGF